MSMNGQPRRSTAEAFGQALGRALGALVILGMSAVVVAFLLAAFVKVFGWACGVMECV